MTDHLDRRGFLATGTVGLAAAVAAGRVEPAASTPGDEHRGAVAIASGNGVAATRLAIERMNAGAAPVVAGVEGVGLVEADPADMSVGLGGLPNERGVVELDASAMDGPTHKAGAVASIRATLHPAQVALKVLQTTDHVMLVGEGATAFARAHGFGEVDLLTERAREAWLRWKRNLSGNDDWLDESQMDWSLDGKERAMIETPEGSVPFTHGTIHLSAVNADGDVGATTTTSGLSYKIPGRVGDSPIVGAGMYCDNAVGSAGATGRGEAVIQSCGAFSVVQHMGRGMTPTEACLTVLREIAERSKRQRRLVDERGRPRFNVFLYAARKDGAYGAASMWGPGRFAVATEGGARLEDAASVYTRGG